MSVNFTTVAFEDGSSANNLRINTRTGNDYTPIDVEFQGEGVAFTYQGATDIIKMFVPWANISYIEQVV